MELPDIDYGRVVIGFHGTTREIAERLCRGEPFKESDNKYDWLGTGIYFWEYAPFRAWNWAKKQHKTNAAVVGALIRLGKCFDLLDPWNTILLEKTYDSVKEADSSLENTPKKHFFDCAALNLFVDQAKEKGIVFDTVRAAFIEGLPNEVSPVSVGSAIIQHVHIQLTVRNPGNIISVWSIKEDGHYGCEKSPIVS